MELFRGQSGPEVWLSAAEYLMEQDGRQDFDVILHINDPVALSEEDRGVVDLVDEFLVEHGSGSLSTVAETIFPLQDYLRGGAEGVFETYPDRMQRIHAVRSDRRWGCYAMRMLRQKDRNGETYNPLEDLTAKIKAMPQYKASFELGAGKEMSDDALAEDIAIYDGAQDRHRPYGGPCLSHLSVKIDDGSIRLNATYRSHYYMQRTLGNIIGLGYLQYFLAHETGMGIGPLTINSTYAKLDSGFAPATWKVKEMRSLLSDCRSQYLEEAA